MINKGTQDAAQLLRKSIPSTSRANSVSKRGQNLSPTIDRTMDNICCSKAISLIESRNRTEMEIGDEKLNRKLGFLVKKQERARHRAEIYAINAMLQQIEQEKFEAFLASKKSTKSSDDLSDDGHSSDDSSALPDIKQRSGGNSSKAPDKITQNGNRIRSPKRPSRFGGV